MAGELATIGKSSAVPFLLGGVVGAGMVAMIPPKSGKENLSGLLLRYLIKRKMRLLKKDIERFAATTSEQISRAVEQGTDTFEKRKSGLVETAQKSRSLYEENKEKIADFYQSVGESIQKGKSIYEEQKKLADLSLAVLPVIEKSRSVFDELKGKIKDVAQPLAGQKGESREQKKAAESTRPIHPLIMPIAAGTATGVAMLLLSTKSGKDLGKDILRKDLAGFAVDAGKLLVNLKTGRR
jgi:gas vesicle protein